MIFGSSCSKKVASTQHKSVYVQPHSTQSADSFFEAGYSVSLETTADNLISSIDKIQLSDSLIWVLGNKRDLIYTFDCSGNYIRTLQKRGNGPEEYLDVTDFQVFRDHVYVLARTNKKIFIYTLSGRYAGHYPLDDWYDYFYITDHTILLYSNFSNNKGYNLIEFNPISGRYGKKSFPFPRNQNFRSTPSPFMIDEENIFFAQPYDYTIYSLNANTLDANALVTLNFETKDKLPKEPYMEDFFTLYQEYRFKSVVKRISATHQRGNLLYVLYLLDYTPHITKIDRASGKNESLKLEYDAHHPYFFSQPFTIYHQYVVSAIHAPEVLFFDKEFKSDKNSDGRLHEEDNPVLFFNKLRNECPLQANQLNMQQSGARKHPAH
jgi:hypothetical protein